MQILDSRIRRRAVAGLPAGFVVAGCALPTAATGRADEQATAAVDDDYVAAELRRDETTMRRLVDDRFVFSNADGTTTDKEAFLRRVLQLPLVGDSVRERSIVVEGDTAIVFATADLRLGRPDRPESASVLGLRDTWSTSGAKGPGGCWPCRWSHGPVRSALGGAPEARSACRRSSRA